MSPWRAARATHGKWLTTAAALIGSTALWPAAAQAHLVTTGFGSYYDGMAHLALTPGDVLMVVGLGLLAGLRGAPSSRAMLLALPAAWLCGGLMGMAWPVGGELPLLMVLSFGSVGALVALDVKLPRPAIIGVACLAGLLHGYADGATMAAGGQGWLALIGVASAVFAVATLVPALVVSRRADWERIVVRVGGSWIAAIGMLMLGWLARGVR